MEWRLLERIEFSLDEAEFLAQMHVKPGSEREADCAALIAQARELARPRALYLPKRIEALDETGMTVDGLRFESSLFQPRLQAGEEIYFFLATCGAEIIEWSRSFRGDLLQYYWTDCLAERAMRVAVAALEEALRPHIGEEFMAAMDPGSLPAWPLTEQRPLFALLGAGAAACGVQLTDHCLMQPQKSVSGFYFRSTVEYYNCELCPRLRCPSRRAEFSGTA